MTTMQQTKQYTCSLVKVPSTFPIASRPIYVYPIANVSHKTKDIAYDRIALGVSAIIERHPADRILVHTVSYDLTRHLQSRLSTTTDRRLAWYTESHSRDAAIREYRLHDKAILLASSLDRGIDLPDDDCRAIIVCKVPYPNLGDKQVNARIHSRGGQLWYTVQTIRTLVQMTGRGMRSEDDYCESYILDENFMSQIYRKNRQLLPAWWREALVMQGLGRLI